MYGIFQKPFYRAFQMCMYMVGCFEQKKVIRPSQNFGCLVSARFGPDFECSGGQNHPTVAWWIYTIRLSLAYTSKLQQRQISGGPRGTEREAPTEQSITSQDRLAVRMRQEKEFDCTPEVLMNPLHLCLILSAEIPRDRGTFCLSLHAQCLCSAYACRPASPLLSSP